MAQNTNKSINRRSFLLNAGRAAFGLALGGLVYRVISAHMDEETAGPRSRYVWAINPDKCTFCGKCETHCNRTPSAVKAVNDQKKCSCCVVCYGHITNKEIPSEKIMSDGLRICPHDAVTRVNYSGGKDGYFIYDIDDDKCTGCGKCAKGCNDKGTKSMFLIIRPDLCLNCNGCNIASACPDGAIERLYYGPEDNFRGIYELEGMNM
ncbi:4Fe-4S dicluster domain-containing protein [Carboxylicivirga sp. RSCT41]|uniref:4Fe-4S dicluster domain-containing protein n=1 Tax=Carboxylicivirga agarovorans TaxID=3417570 RepID=UPI003D347CD5